MQLFNIFDDYEKKYQSWLRDKTTQWGESYKGSWLDEKTGLLQEKLWGKAPQDIPGQPPIHQMQGTTGWFGSGGEGMSGGFQKKDWENIKSGSVAQNIDKGVTHAVNETRGYPIGYGKGKVDPGLAKPVKANEGTIEKWITPPDRVGGGWTKTAISKYNEIAEEHFSRFAIKDANGKTIKKNGIVQLNDEGKAKYKETVSEFINDKKNEMPGNLDQTGKMGAGTVTEDDAKGLAKFAGVSFEEMQSNWKKKGGMDGLLANPAFTLGLALMQSSAQGKSIGAGAMDNFIQAAGLSEHYKDRLKDRRNIMGPVSDEQRDMVMSALPTDILAPGRIEGLFGGDVARGHNAALNKVYEEVYEKMAGSKDWDYSKGTKQLKEKDFRKVFDRMVKSGEIKIIQRVGKGSYLSIKGFDADDKSLQGHSGDVMDSIGDWFKKKKKDVYSWLNPDKRAEGGPINAGQPYLVGEKGPEIVVPNQDGQVLSNDDSQVFAMLLNANPQLQNISRTRAEAILKSRFPDYFV